MKTIVDVCPICGQVLAIQDTLQAVKGTLYCSKKCAVAGLMSEANTLPFEDCKTYAQLGFDAYAEEITPIDAGITKEEVFTAYSEDADMTTIFKSTKLAANDTEVMLQVIGFYWGEPDKKSTELFSGNLRAVIGQEDITKW